MVAFASPREDGYIIHFSTCKRSEIEQYKQEVKSEKQLSALFIQPDNSLEKEVKLAFEEIFGKAALTLCCGPSTEGFDELCKHILRKPVEIETILNLSRTSIHSLNFKNRFYEISAQQKGQLNVDQAPGLIKNEEIILAQIIAQYRNYNESQLRQAYSLLLIKLRQNPNPAVELRDRISVIQKRLDIENGPKY